MRRRSEIEIFSLSFLDLLSCGLGSMMLLFVMALLLVDRQAKIALRDAESRRAQAQARLEALRALEKSAEARRGRAQVHLESAGDELRNLPGGTDDAMFREIERLRQDIEEARSKTEVPAFEVERPLVGGVSFPSERSVLFLIDCSGSMRGESQKEVHENRRLGVKGRKWERVKEVVRSVLETSGEGCPFRVFLYNDQLQEVSKKWRGATPDAVEATLKVLDEVEPDGGSDLKRALLGIAKVLQDPVGLAARVYLLTDALPNQGEPRQTDRVEPEMRRSFLAQAAIDGADALGGWSGRGRITVVLLPWQDDPDAAELYWHKLLNRLEGSVLVLPRDGT